MYTYCTTDAVSWRISDRSMAGNFKINSLLEDLYACIPDVFPSKSLRQAAEAPQCEESTWHLEDSCLCSTFSRNLFCVAELLHLTNPHFLPTIMANKATLQTQPLQPLNKGKSMTTARCSSAACESGSSTWLCRNAPPRASLRSSESLTLQFQLLNFFTWLEVSVEWIRGLRRVCLQHLQQSQKCLEITHTLHAHTVQRCTHNTSLSGCRYED